MSKIRVGLEAIAVDVPEHFVDMASLARARGVDAGKYLIGLGQSQMAVATPCEDTVSLAACAGLRLLKNFDVDPSSIGLIITGTETAVDHSKPVSIYVHEMLGLSESCRAFETKHACYGAMAGVTTAINWVHSGRAKGKKALIIASDIARYGAGTPGEPTQGAGAVALLVSDSPELLEFDTRYEGYYAKQVMDFWRPLYSKEAFADGHFSIECYLNALSGAYGMYRKSSLEGQAPSGRFSDRFAACLYHAPFVKMAQKAHSRLLEVDAEMGFAKDSPEAMAAAKDFNTRVAPYLQANARIGNIYTGALFLSLLNFLEDKGPETVGREISLFSYGSGSVAEFLTGTVCEKVARAQAGGGYRALLDSRSELTIEKYEEILLACASADQNGAEYCDPASWGLKRKIAYAGTREHQRRYERLE